MFGAVQNVAVGLLKSFIPTLGERCSLNLRWHRQDPLRSAPVPREVSHGPEPGRGWVADGGDTGWVESGHTPAPIRSTAGAPPAPQTIFDSLCRGLWHRRTRDSQRCAQTPGQLSVGVIREGQAVTMATAVPITTTQTYPHSFRHLLFSHGRRLFRYAEL